MYRRIDNYLYLFISAHKTQLYKTVPEQQKSTYIEYQNDCTSPIALNHAGWAVPTVHKAV